jgi:hypothetical protein
LQMSKGTVVIKLFALQALLFMSLTQFVTNLINIFRQH